jgi:twitching motility two-component system response regulator PilG
MNTNVPIKSPIIEQISSNTRSGYLIIQDPKDRTISWKLYLNGSNLEYGTSTIGQKERLTCWCQKLPIDISPLESTSVDFEYQELYQLWNSQKLPPINLKQLILRLTNETLGLVLSFGSTEIEFVEDAPLEPALVSCPFASLLEQAQKLTYQWLALQPFIHSPFVRLYLDKQNIYKFYEFWKQINNQPEYSQFFRTQNLSDWLNILAKKTSIYELATQIGTDPLLIARIFRPLLENEVIQAMPFKITNGKFLTNEINRVVACIDDSKTVQKQIKTVLETVGFQVINITNPSQALTILARQQPSVILMDINMPEIDGYELCKMLRRSRKLKDVPVIMLTGREGLIDRLRAQLVGANHYLTKPCDPNHLIDLVKRLSQPSTSNSEINLV